MHLNITERKRAQKIVRQATSQVVRSRKKQSRIELLILIGLTGGFFGLEYRLDWFQNITDWILTRGAHAVDDIIFTLVFLVAGLAVFGFRRWRESESELTLRRQSQGVLELLHGELENQVEERTEELAGANRTLNAEIAERKRAAASLAELAQQVSRTNQALTESDKKFRQLADNISDVFWVTSPDLKEIRYVSPGYEMVWGRPAESLYAHPHQWLDTIVAEEREKVFRVFGDLMNTSPEVSVDYKIARPDGTIRWIHDRGFQVRDAAGKLVGLTGIASDITESKEMEAQLSQAQKLKAIGTLAGGIAHDFNNILAAIMGYSEMAKRGISQDSRAQVHLQQVLIASSRAKDLVNQILTFSRLEEPHREALELQPIIAETLNLVRVSLHSTVEIHRDIDPDVPSVLGDATQLQQLTLNLCVNAAQAMKEHGGVLGVRLTCRDIDRDFAGTHPELKEGPHVRLDVSDSGGGMDPATQERIFEPFFTTKAPGEGTGLGLAVAHGVIKNHGGAIVVSSVLGVGTTFSVYLPVYDRPPAPIIHEPDSVPRGKGERILLVDDEEALVSLGQSILEDLGYRVTTMTDSVEALATFSSQPEDFDVVITDQSMPRLKGTDLATALLEIRPALPIILVTGYSAGMTQEKARATGIRELIAKPYPIQVLGDAIRRSLVETKEE